MIGYMEVYITVLIMISMPGLLLFMIVGSADRSGAAVERAYFKIVLQPTYADCSSGGII